MKRFGITVFAVALLTLPVILEASGDEGKASIGASGGIMKFNSGEEWSSGDWRPIGQLIFKYNISDRWAGVLETGWGWNAYPGDTLAVVVPTTLGVEWRTPLKSKLWFHFGGGGGFYFLGVKDSYNSWAKAGDKIEELTWFSPGLYGKLGGEWLLESGLAINLDFLFHAIFSKNEEAYGFTPLRDCFYTDCALIMDPAERAACEECKQGEQERLPFLRSWGVENTSFVEFRLGLNYYFNLGGSSPAPEGEETEGQ